MRAANFPGSAKTASPALRARGGLNQLAVSKERAPTMRLILREQCAARPLADKCALELGNPQTGAVQAIARGGRSTLLAILAIFILARLVSGGFEGSITRKPGICGGTTITTGAAALQSCKQALCFSEQHEQSFMSWLVDAIIGIGAAHSSCTAAAGIGAASVSKVRIKMSNCFMLADL